MRAGYITTLGRVIWDALTVLALAWGGPFRAAPPRSGNLAGRQAHDEPRTGEAIGFEEDASAHRGHEPTRGEQADP